MIREEKGWKKLQVPSSNVHQPTVICFEMNDGSELEVRRKDNSIEIVMGESFSSRSTIKANSSGGKCILCTKYGKDFHGFSVTHNNISVHCGLIPETAQNEKSMAMLPDLFKSVIGENLEVRTELHKKIRKSN